MYPLSRLVCACRRLCAMIAVAVLAICTAGIGAAQAPPRPPTNEMLFEVVRLCEARLKDRMYQIAKDGAFLERMKIKHPHKTNEISEIKRIIDKKIRAAARYESLTKMILLNLAYSLSSGKEAIKFGHFVKHASCRNRR